MRLLSNLKVILIRLNFCKQGCMTNSRVSKKKRTNSTVDDEVEILK